jgi:hypothetical protein
MPNRRSEAESRQIPPRISAARPLETTCFSPAKSSFAVSRWRDRGWQYRPRLASQVREPESSGSHGIAPKLSKGCSAVSPITLSDASERGVQWCRFSRSKRKFSALRGPSAPVLLAQSAWTVDSSRANTASWCSNQTSKRA